MQHFENHQNVFLNSIQHQEITKCHKNLDMWYNMLGAIIAVTFFFYKSVAQVEVTCGNKET